MSTPPVCPWMIWSRFASWIAWISAITGTVKIVRANMASGLPGRKRLSTGEEPAEGGLPGGAEVRRGLGDVEDRAHDVQAGDVRGGPGDGDEGDDDAGEE